MVRFYRMEPHQVRALDILTFNDLWLGITVIECEEIKQNLKEADWPNMKDEERRKYYGNLTKLDNKLRERKKEAPKLSNKDLFEIITGVKKTKPGSVKDGGGR